MKIIKNTIVEIAKGKTLCFGSWAFAIGRTSYEPRRWDDGF